MGDFTQDTDFIEKDPVKPLNFGSPLSVAPVMVNYLKPLDNYLKNLQRLPEPYRRDAYEAYAEGRSIQARVDPTFNNRRVTVFSDSAGQSLDPDEEESRSLTKAQTWLLSGSNKGCDFLTSQINLDSLKAYLFYPKRDTELFEFFGFLETNEAFKTMEDGEKTQVAELDKKIISMYTTYGPLQLGLNLYYVTLFVSVDYDYDISKVRRFSGANEKLRNTYASFLSVYKTNMNEEEYDDFNHPLSITPARPYELLFSCQIIKGQLYYSKAPDKEVNESNNILIGRKKLALLSKVVFLRGLADLQDAAVSLNDSGGEDGGEQGLIDSGRRSKLIQRLSLIPKLKTAVRGLQIVVNNLLSEEEDISDTDTIIYDADEDNFD